MRGAAGGVRSGHLVQADGEGRAVGQVVRQVGHLLRVRGRLRNRVRGRARVRVSGEVGHREVLGHESLPWIAREVGAYVVVEPAQHHLLGKYLGEGRHLRRCREIWERHRGDN